MPHLNDEQVGTIWSKAAEAWQTFVSREDFLRNDFTMPEFLDLVGDVRGLELLDVGCGTGTSCRILAERGARVTGVDIAEQMLEIARSHWSPGEQIDYRNVSLADLSGLGLGRFDRVVSMMAIMDIPGFEQGAKEIHDVLKAGGEFVFCVRHPCFRTAFSKRVRTESGTKLLVGDYFREEPWFEKVGVGDNVVRVPRFPYKASDYINFLTKAGFSIVELKEPQVNEPLVTKWPALKLWVFDAAMLLLIKARKEV
jgi:2-polyprenyl-3-methyl-5-hydroxy-6-metoxy-1,4-benzoquinol methylase